jgi:hypothetical protein
VSDRMQRRARRARSRWAVRRWEYRQRDLASGVWFQLRRVPADAREAYAIAPEQARALIAEGARPEPVGARLEPPKIILFVSTEQLERIEDRRQLRLHLDRHLLAAEALALVRFDLRR